MQYKTFQILQEEDKSTIASLWEQYEKAAKSDASDSGWFKVIATTDDVDRDGESISVDAWDFKNYEMNPVVLWAHDFSLMPIAKVEKITKSANGYIVEGPFAPSERGQEARKNYDAGFLNTMSVGFLPKEKKGNVITKAELLEISFVPVPANANAVAQRAIEEMSMKMLKKDGEPEPVAEHEEKVIIADVADAQDATDDSVMQAKWSNMEEVMEICGALYEVYMRPEVASEAFDGLLKESIDLLSALLGARVPADDGAVAMAMSGIDGKALTKSFEESFWGKVGRVLSSSNRKRVSDAVDAMEGAKSALQGLLDETASDTEKAIEPEPTTEVDEPTAKSNDPEAGDIIAAVLRGIDKAVGKELRDLKRKI